MKDNIIYLLFNVPLHVIKYLTYLLILINLPIADTAV